MTPDQTCIQRERYGIPYTDPDLVNSIAARLAASNRLEWLCDKSGIWITPDMIAFNADQTMAWGDRDYEDPPLASIEQHLLRVQEVLDEVAFEKRQVWVEKQVKSSAERAKHKAVDQLPNALEELFSKTPKAGRKEATENLGALLKKIIRKAGLRPKLGDMLTTVVFCNQNGFKSRRFTKPKETLKSVRRDYLMHHGWDGKDDEPEWATDIRVSRVIFTEAFDGHGRGERWIVAPIPNPKETVSSYVDPSPGVGDDGNYRWVGSALVFDPHWAFNEEGSRRLSIAEFETTMVQGAQIEDDFIPNELVGGDPVTLDLDDGLNWNTPEDDSPFDTRCRGCNGDYWDPSHLSHDESFFYGVLIGMGEFDLAESMLRRGPGPDRLGLIKTARGIVLEHLGPEDPGKPWQHDRELQIAMIEQMGMTDYLEFKEYF